MTIDVRPGPTIETRIVTYADGQDRPRYDRLATEEPLEIRVRVNGAVRTAAVTMRTPGNDFELAAGFLFGEGIVSDMTSIRGISYCVDRDVEIEQRYNIVNVELQASALPNLAGLERHFMMTSACGVCGKASIDALKARRLATINSRLHVEPTLILGLPDRLRDAQRVFASTGGLHAAAIFDARGEVVAVREDVGRHNAFDKLVGWALMNGRLPLDAHIALLSGRASYELVQKAVSAGIPIVCAVSAPSSLAVDVARAFQLTLLGFLRNGRFNIYAGSERITLAECIAV